MNCVIPGRGVRAFGKAIQCLSKIGDELYVEALREGLALKTVNSARSAFASFLFSREFFHSYSDGLQTGGEGGEGEGEGEEADTIKCKITIKSCLTVFRALSTLEKTVDHCTLQLNLKLSKLVFIFHCRHGIVKTHNLGFQECEALQAVFTKDLCPNHIVVQSRTLSEVVLNFPTFLEEVTMAANPENVHLKNYSEEDSVDSRSTLTEVCLLPDEFDDYQIGVDTAITFCLKELRAVLLFTDAQPHSLSVRFESAGRPVVFSIDDSSDYKADFVLATLLVDSTTSASTTQRHHSAGTTAPSTHSAARQKRNAGSTALNGVAENGRERRGANEVGLTRSEEDNETIEEDKWSFLSGPGRGRSSGRGGRGRASERGRVLPHRTLRNSKQIGIHTASESSLSQHQTTSDHISQRHVSPGHRGSHASQQSDDGGGVMMEVVDGDREEGGWGGKERGRGRRDGAVSQVLDPLDILFGEENAMDVGEEGGGGWEAEGGGGGWEGEGGGGGFGMVPPPVAAARSSTGEPKDKPTARSPHPHLPTLPTSTTATSTPHSPPPPHTQPPSSPVRDAGAGGLWEGTTTQDSILQDSGFLPGTPPAKKFKASSLLFGVDLFTSDPCSPEQPEILAPDSEEDSD